MRPGGAVVAFLLVSGLIVVFALPYGRTVQYQVKVPYQTTETKYKYWGSFDAELGPGGFATFPVNETSKNETFYIPQPVIIETSANNSMIQIVNGSNFTAFQSGLPWQAELSDNVVGQSNVSYTPEPFEEYYIIAKNLNSASPQHVHISIWLQYQESVTLYTTENRIRFEPGPGFLGSLVIVVGLVGTCTQVSVKEINEGEFRLEFYGMKLVMKSRTSAQSFQLGMVAIMLAAAFWIVTLGLKNLGW